MILFLPGGNANILSHDDISHKFVEQSSLVAVLYHGHPFAQRPFLYRKDLKNERFLYTSLGNTYPSSGDNYYLDLYQKAGYSPNTLFHSNDMESIFMMVAAEEGISVMPSYITDKLTNADNLVFVPLMGDEETENIAAIWKKENRSFPLRQFLELL